jgi:hypothetical protein
MTTGIVFDDMPNIHDLSSGATGGHVTCALTAAPSAFDCRGILTAATCVGMTVVAPFKPQPYHHDILAMMMVVGRWSWLLQRFGRRAPLTMAASME